MIKLSAIFHSLIELKVSPNEKDVKITVYD